MKTELPNEIGCFYAVTYRPTNYTYNRNGYLRSINEKSISFFTDENMDEYFSFNINYLLTLVKL